MAAAENDTHSRKASFNITAIMWANFWGLDLICASDDVQYDVIYCSFSAADNDDDSEGVKSGKN